jgi:hypothetical protein
MFINDRSIQMKQSTLFKKNLQVIIYCMTVCYSETQHTDIQHDIIQHNYTKHIVSLGSLSCFYCYVECCNAECRYADCRGTIVTADKCKMHERVSLTNFIAETKSILLFSSWERVESLLNKKVHYILILL